MREVQDRRYARRAMKGTAPPRSPSVTARTPSSEGGRKER